LRRILPPFESTVTVCRFGEKVLLVFLLEWETLFPVPFDFEQTSQTFDMIAKLI